MRTAIYARKSTDQSHVSEAQKSVSRQVDQARRYAARKGWSPTDEHVYVDDGLSGAEFATRPGFLRLMNALKPRPDFQVLVMSEESRLGREAIETAYAPQADHYVGRTRVLLPRGPGTHAGESDGQDHAQSDDVRGRAGARESAAAHV